MTFTRHSFARIKENSRGFSLLEMLISISIFTIILTIVFTTFNLQHKTSKSQDEKASALNSAHFVLDAISKTIKLVGSGLTNGSITAALGGDVNGATDTVTVVHGGSDTVTFVGVFEENEGKLNGVANKDDSSIILDDTGVLDDNLKKYISIGGQDSYTITSIIGNTVNISPNLTKGYKDKTPVFLIKAVTYQIIDEDFKGRKIPTLKVNENTGGNAQPFVKYINDIQIDLLPSASDWDRGSITVVAVTKTPNKGTITLHAVVRSRNK